MDELLTKATQGVDPDAPDAAFHIFMNLMGLLPWTQLFWWTLGFIVVGAALGSWRGRLLEGIVWAALFGPLGWLIVLRPRSRAAVPPPLRPKRPS